MSRLGGISLVLGAVTGMVSACFICFPSASSLFARAFPRRKVAGAIMACVALVWATVLLMRMNLGFLEGHKVLLLVLSPIVFVLTVFFVDELLGPRALGGILLLVPAPILDAARWHESAWRYFAIVSAYIMVIKGISLVLSPYLFRKWCDAFLTTDRATRLWGLAGMLYSLTWILLGILVY